MSIRTTLVNRLRRATLRSQLTMLYAGLLVVVVAVVLVAAAFLFRTATAPPGVETNHGTSFEIGAAVVIVLAVLVGLWFAWQLAGLYLRPLRTLNATARDISATNLHRRLELKGPDDELTQLGSTLDDLFGRLESSFESQRRFVANASHELRTPLAGQRTLLQVALADPDASDESLRAACEEALALGERQERLVDGLLTLASSERGIECREPLDLAEIAERVLVSRQQEAARRGVEIRASLDAAPTTGDPVLIESMIANLLDNAIQHNTPRREHRPHDQSAQGSIPGVSGQHGPKRSHGRSRATLSALPAARTQPNPVWRRSRARPGHRSSHRQSPRCQDHRTPPLGWRARRRGQLPLATRLDHGPVMTQHIAAA